MIYIHWIPMLLYGLLVAGTIITVLLDNRQPVKTVTWIMVLLFIPVVGPLLYFFFGQDTRKMRFISQRSLDQLTKRSMLEFAEQRDLQLPDAYEPLISQFKSQSLASPFKDNEVDFFIDGHSCFLSLLGEIGRAKHHIHIDVYIIDDDALGRLVADALIDKAHQGVEVRLIYDDVGCWNVSNRFFERMRDAGIDVHAFMPVKFPAFTSKINYRNHRKICVIDGSVGFIGGMNIATRYVRGTDSGQPWRDTHLRVRGGVVYALQCAFLIDWYFVDRTLITNRRYYPNLKNVVRGGCLAQVVTSSPVMQWPEIMQGYVRILLGARRYVYIETPYFLPTEAITLAMRTAVMSGVDVRLMVPMHTDTPIIAWASMSYVRAIARAGVKVYLYTPGFNHSKLLVSDDSLCTCGSTNVDFRSFENNFEANIFLYGEDVARRVKRMFLDDQAHCVTFESVAGRAKRPFLRRLGESLVRLLSPLL